MKPQADPNAPHPPRPGVVSPTARNELLTDLDWYDVSVTDDLSGASLGQVQIRSAQLTSALLVGTDLQAARIIDATFDGCDLSGARLDEASLTRVAFRDCRLSGVQLSAARLHDVRFIGCRLDGASFRMAEGKRVCFEECVLTEAEFSAAQLDRCRFLGCDLTSAEFSQARIPDAALLGSTVEGLRGVSGLQRPIIDVAQVMPFALSLLALHGVVIQRQDDD